MQGAICRNRRCHSIGLVKRSCHADQPGSKLAVAPSMPLATGMRVNAFTRHPRRPRHRQQPADPRDDLATRLDLTADAQLHAEHDHAAPDALSAASLPMVVPDDVFAQARDGHGGNASISNRHGRARRGCRAATPQRSSRLPRCCAVVRLCATRRGAFRPNRSCAN